MQHLDEPFFGRTAELGQLQGLLDETVRSGTCHLVIVHGEPGVGKTRFAAEFAAKAAEQGALIGAGRCEPYRQGSTLRALAAALSQVVDAARDCGALEPGPGRDVRDALASLSSGLFRDGSPGELPDQVLWAATLVLHTIGQRRPVLLLIDDLQSAKPLLLDVLGQLAAKISEAPVIMLGLCRPELIEAPDPPYSGCQHANLLPLGPLSDQEAELLVAALSEVAPHQAGLTEQIVRRAEGNPFFLEQLVAITEQDAQDSLPPTVRSVIAARLDLLEPAHRDVLLRAAVPGRRFTTPELGALLAEDPTISDPAAEALSTLAHRRLIMPERASDEYRFSGVLIRDVAYHTLSKRARLRYHETLAAWYKRDLQGDDRVGQHLENAYRLAAELHPVGHHQVRRLRSDAAQTLARAGELALRRSDLTWAADLLARSLRIYDETAPGRKAVRVQLAEAELLLGVDPDARQTLRTLAGEALADGDQRTACHARLLLAALELPGPSAAEDALAAIPVFEAASDHLGLTRAWLRVAQLNQLGGHYGQAEVLLRYALRHAQQTDTQFELATVIGSLATSLWRGPTPTDAALDGCQSLLAEHAEGRRAVRATVNCPRAVLLASRGEYDSARSLVCDATQIIEQLGHVYGTASLLIFAATVEGLAGRWDTAEARLRDALGACVGRGDTLSEVTATTGLTRALLEQGDATAALAAAEAVEITTDPLLDADIYGVRARALAERGDHERAWREAGNACAVAAVTDSLACQATAELDRAHVLRALGDQEMAAVAAQAAADLFTMKGHLIGAELAASLAEAP
jgi:tetratricopeptide (TPR) repeat protein